MKLALFLLPQAETDIDEHCAYIALDNMEAALRFDDAVFGSLDQLCKTPLIGAERTFNNPRLLGLRMWFVRGFERYLIFYRSFDDRLEAIRVLHSAQDRDSIFEDVTR